MLITAGEQIVPLAFMYFVKTPFWLKKIFNDYTWHINTREKVLYLTFDDGPHPVATPFVLDQLDRFQAKASFFCVGKNVLAHSVLYEHILKKGHVTGNHTHNHLNGWKTNMEDYLGNVEEASKCIDSRLFRPPYGRIRQQTGKRLIGKDFRVVMWDVLSGDFDRDILPEQCAGNVIKKAGAGSIVVFHDSEKAYNNLAYALPRVLAYFAGQGFRFDSLPMALLK